MSDSLTPNDDQARRLAESIARLKPPRSARKASGADETSGISVAVAVFPTSTLSLQGELRLVRAALLYADEVRLCSPKSTLVASLAALTELNEKETLDFLEQVGPIVQPGIEVKIAHLRQFLARRISGGRELASQWKFRRELREHWKFMEDHAKGLLAASGAEELDPAIRAGLVKVDLIDIGTGMEDMLPAYMARLLGFLSDGRTYPLFDDKTGDLVRAGREAGIFVVPPAAERRATEIGLGSGLITELPTFPDAPMESILEARAAIEGHLARFRRAVAKLRSSLETTALEEGFTDEVAGVYATEVQAAMEEINAALQAPSFGSRVLRASLKSAPAPGVLGLAAFSVAHLEPLVSGLISGAGFLLSTANDLREQARSREKEAARNDLFLLYRANQILGE